MNHREKALCDKIAAAIPNVSFWAKEDGKRILFTAVWLNPVRAGYPGVVRTDFAYVNGLVDDPKFDLVVQVKRDIEFAKASIEPRTRVFPLEEFNPC